MLADELLEGFFDKALAASFQLVRTEAEDFHQANQKPEGLLGGLMNLVVNDSYVPPFHAMACQTEHMLTLGRNKTRFNRLADGFGSALGKHAEWRKPALSKINSPTSPQPVDLGTRESLLTPQQQQQQRQRSQSSVSQLSTQSGQSSSSPSARTPETRSLAEVESRYREESQMVRAAQEAVMQRPNFAIDAIGDSDGEDDEAEVEDDSGVMDEVSPPRSVYSGLCTDPALGGSIPQSARR